MSHLRVYRDGYFPFPGYLHDTRDQLLRDDSLGVIGYDNPGEGVMAGFQVVQNYILRVAGNVALALAVEPYYLLAVRYYPRLYGSGAAVVHDYSIGIDLFKPQLMDYPAAHL